MLIGYFLSEDALFVNYSGVFITIDVYGEQAKVS
jgi:hypothetical protein